MNAWREGVHLDEKHNQTPPDAPWRSGEKQERVAANVSHKEESEELEDDCVLHVSLIQTAQQLSRTSTHYNKTDDTQCPHTDRAALCECLLS